MKHQTIVQAQEIQTQQTILASDGISLYTGIPPRHVSNSFMAKDEIRP